MPGGRRDVGVLAHGAQFLAELGPQEHHDEHAEHGDHDERDERHAEHPAFDRDLDANEVVERVLDARQVDRVAEPEALRQQHPPSGTG